MAEKDLAKVYEPKSVEEKWYGVWEEKGYFHASLPAPQPSYSIVIPPPTLPASSIWGMR